VALQPTRLEYRISLSNVDRAREVTESVYLARHPSETHAHATLRVLAWCLLNEDRLEFGPGLSDPDAPDLWTRDLTGRLTTWIECGNAAADKLRKAQQHNPNLAVHVVMDDARRAAELAEELAATRLPRASTPPTLWIVDASLLAQLATREQRRQKWSVTVVGDHLYLECDGEPLDGAVTRG
jgi:uncharacterized protein YaeQ